jgi:zinc transporter, ZIP family
MSRKRRRQLSYLFIVCLIAGAMLGFLLLRHQPIGPKMVLIALAAGFLFTTVTQSMIPEANREGEPSFAGILFMAGLSIYALATLAL